MGKGDGGSAWLQLPVGDVMGLASFILTALLKIEMEEGGPAWAND